jgi:adenosylhomocysteinase
MKAVDSKHFENMKDGAVVANSGHFNIEINIEALEAMSEAKRQVREFVEEYTLEDGRKVFLLAQGRLINLGAAEGHPPSVMDMSFANQALAGEYIMNHHTTLDPGVYTLPSEVDTDIASLKLGAMGMSYDTLTAEQDVYLNSWEVGT